MKKRVFIVFLVLLLSVSFVSAAWLETNYGWKWVTGSAIDNSALSPKPPTSFIIADVISTEVLYNKSQKNLVVKVIDLDGTPSTPAEGMRVVFALTYDIPGQEWPMLIPYLGLAFNENTGYYGGILPDVTLPAGVSTIRVILDFTKGSEFVRYHGYTYSVTPTELYTKIINGVKITAQDIFYTENKIDRSAVLIIDGIAEKFNVGQQKIVNGQNIILENVGSTGAVLVNVNGVLDTLGPTTGVSEPGAPEPIPSPAPTKVINGVKIGVVKYLYDQGDPTKSEAVLTINGIANSFVVGQTKVVGGNEITLVKVGSTGIVLVNVDGVLDTIGEAEPTPPTQICPAVYEPVCATDGTSYKTFSNICEAGGLEVAYKGECSEKIITPTEPIKIQPEQICNGCLIDTTCVPFGTRQKGQFCDISKQFVIQKELGATCENSYECRSNECSDGECISTANLLQKLIDWLSRIFGGK